MLCPLHEPPYTRSRELWHGVIDWGGGSEVPRVALTGDYALLHRGLPALIDVYEKKSPLLCIVMKNNCMAMTGGQQSYDITPYMAWASPVTCRADDERKLRDLIRFPESPLAVIIEGNCPEGRHHETVEC